MLILFSHKKGLSATSDLSDGGQPFPPPASAEQSSCSMKVVLENELFAIEAVSCHLTAVLAELAARGGIEIKTDPSLEDALVSVSLFGKNIEDAIGNLLDATGQKNFAIEYEAATDKGGDRRARKLFLARRASNDTGKSDALETIGEPAQENIIHYSPSNGLSVRVKNVEVTQLFALIEEEVNRTRRRELRIIMPDRIDVAVSFTSEGSLPQDILDYALHLVGTNEYMGEFHVAYTIIDGKTKKIVSVYIVRKISPEEAQERQRKIQDYIEDGKKLSAEGSYREAADKFGAILFIDKFNADARFFLGLNSLRKGAPAVESFKRTLQEDPGYVDAYYWLGVAYEKERNRKEAVSAFKEYVARGKDNKLREEATKKLEEFDSAALKIYRRDLATADKHLMAKEYQDAEEIYKRLIAENPDRPEAYVPLAKLYIFYLRNLEAAVDVLQRLEDGSQKSSLLLLVSTAYKKDNPSMARKILEDLSRKKPGKDIEAQIEEVMKDLE